MIVQEVPEKYLVIKCVSYRPTRYSKGTPAGRDKGSETISKSRQILKILKCLRTISTYSSPYYTQLG